MIIVGHALCQVIEGSEIEYPSAVARCEQRMEPGLPQAVVSCLVKDRLQPRGIVIPQARGVHHLGYWSDDLEADLATLEANGLACEVKSYNPDGSGKLLWAYTKGPTGLRIELVKPGHGTVHRILVVDRAGTLTDQRVGSFRMCWAMMLRWISEVPPAMVPAKLPI